jgi:hypothetical protein
MIIGLTGIAPQAVAQSATRFEETDSAVSLSPGWTKSNPFDWFAWSGGSAVASTTTGARATLNFTGTSVTWIGYRSVDSGLARVLVDGAFVSDVDLFARRDESSARIFSVKDLSNGSHTLTIETTGKKNPESQGNTIVVDAFEVPARVVSHVQDTDPDISYSAGWTGGDISKPWSGGSASFATASGALATLPFNGTGISWIGVRGPDTGIARVSLDGVFVSEVDTYSPILKIQGPVFTATGLADSSHTLTIEATGTKNTASTGAVIWSDAFDVTRTGRRMEEADAGVAYTSGFWNHGNLNRSWSEGTISESDAPGARATVTFTGTSVSWVGCRKANMGIANVYLDGALVRQVDTFAPAPREGYQGAVFTASGLTAGTHRLTIEATGLANPAATGALIVLDAFDIGP